MFQKVNDEILIFTYIKSIAARVDSDFIKLLEDEIYRRFATYKQKRIEKNLMMFISEFKTKVKEIDSNFIKSNISVEQLVREFFSGLEEEKQSTC